MVKANKARETVKAVGLSILFYFQNPTTKILAAASEVPIRYRAPKIAHFGLLDTQVGFPRCHWVYWGVLGRYRPCTQLYHTVPILLGFLLKILSLPNFT